MTQDWRQRDARHVWHPYCADPAPGPKACFTRAEGAYVFDDSGKRYFDGTSSWWCITHGHCHPRLTTALHEQAKTLDQVLLAPHTHPVALELAEKLVDKLGKPFSRVFYSDDGSTAVETALKMALQYWHLRGKPGRRRFLSVENGYHGDTLGAVGVGFVDVFHRHLETAVTPSLAVPQPFCYRCPVGKSYPGCRTECLDGLPALLDRHAHEIAALIVEPLVMGASGMILAPKEHLERLVTLCRERGILVIFDEVFTGFGRTGTLFAMDQVAVRPDIVCLSKGLTAGMLPLAATVTTDAIYEPFRGGEERKFAHGHTFTGNALGCRVALESLRIFEEEEVIGQNQTLVRVLGRYAERFRELPHVGDVRHCGMILALELVADRASKAIPDPASGPGWKIASHLWEKGIWIRPLHNVVYLIPPYATKASELEAVLESLREEILEESHYVG